MDDTQTIINLINIVLFVLGMLMLGVMAVLLKAIERLNIKVDALKRECVKANAGTEDRQLIIPVVSGSLAYQKAVEFAKFKHQDEYYDKAYARDVEDTIYDFQSGFATAMKITNDR